jgi:hypothetical protein
MELPARIQQWMAWPGWRRHAPAAGSVAAHAVVGVALVGLMTAYSKPLPPRVDPAPPEAIDIVLLDEPPLPEVRPAPARAAPRTVPAPKAAPAADAAPVMPLPRKDPKQQTAAPEPAPAEDTESVYVPRSLFASIGSTGGLEGLVNRDPCTALVGTKPKDCAANWAARVGTMDSMMPRSKEEMRQQFAEFIAPCPWKVGCEPLSDGKLLNGARSFGLKSPMASGAGGVQGINEVVGRLGFNPDHTDPGFGD